MRDRLIELIGRADEECKHTKSCKSCSGYGKGALCMITHIADHLLANGVIVPPCKVGDKVYYFSENPLCLSVQPYRIYEADVVRIVTVGLGTSLVIQIRNEYGCTEIPDVNEWGKTVFLTREEAEKALKGGDE